VRAAAGREGLDLARSPDRVAATTAAPAQSHGRIEGVLLTAGHQLKANRFTYLKLKIPSKKDVEVGYCFKPFTPDPGFWLG